MKKNMLIMIMLIFISFSILTDVEADDGYFNISIYRIFVNVEKFENISLSTSGIIGISDRGDYYLYSDLGSMKNDVRINSILLIDTKVIDKTIKLANYIGKYVLIEGTFKKHNYIHQSSGYLEQITRIIEYPLVKG